MIKYKDTILENYFIDPVTAVITNSKGEIQETKINECGRPCFHCMEIHKIQVHTHLGYKKGFDIHHIDENKMNNSLENLVYLSKSEHSKIHNKGENHPLYRKHHSEETCEQLRLINKGKIMSEESRKKISMAMSGENHPLYGTHCSEERKRKISESNKGVLLGVKFTEDHKKKLSESVRQSMLETLNDENPKLFFGGFEMGGASPKTNSTLKKIMKDNKGFDLYYLCGADKKK